MKYLGCAYYPEYWGPERVATDAKLMRAAGINLTRIGEFAWARMEPADGTFTFDWLHAAVDTLGEHGIEVMLCTPTPTPPAWLTFAHPDTLLVNADGRRLDHGSRRHYCYTSETYRRFSKRIVAKLAAEFARHRNVVAWQIDNEPDLIETGICHCENCQQEFRTWLKSRYGSLAELNQRWGTGFWTVDYSDWQQVRLARANHAPSRQLDSRRFANEKLSDFVLFQSELLKQQRADWRVSTNLNGEVFTSLDYFKLFDRLDVACKDLYFDICTMDVNAMIMEQFRSFKPGQKYWVTETGAGMCGCGRPAHPGQFRAWLWSSFAHGGDAHVVFRWRTCLSGQEQELEGMLEHSGVPGHRYKAIQKAFLEMREQSAKLRDLPLPETAVAFVHDYDVAFTYQSTGIGTLVPYEKNFTALHREFYRRNVRTALVPPTADLSPYRLVVLPSLVMINPTLAERLKEFVAGGGVVFAQGQLGLRDANANYMRHRGPDQLQDLFGVLINGGMYLHSCVGVDETSASRTPFTVKLAGKLARGTAAVWLGDLEAQDCRVLLKVQEDTYAGQPAITEKKTDKGLAIYSAAAKLDDRLVGKLVDYALGKAGVAAVKGIPEHVEVIRRGTRTFVINHRAKPVQVKVAKKRLRLPAYGVAVVSGS
ncbi:MAG: Beta-galactosidase bgaB [Verrucomicrobiae bacterium]|nr:Beta-galactosidase bgaB [Verrucomicrobiae bacterium]